MGAQICVAAVKRLISPRGVGFSNASNAARTRIERNALHIAQFAVCAQSGDMKGRDVGCSFNRCAACCVKVSSNARDCAQHGTRRNGLFDCSCGKNGLHHARTRAGSNSAARAKHLSLPRNFQRAKRPRGGEFTFLTPAVSAKDASQSGPASLHPKKLKRRRSGCPEGRRSRSIHIMMILCMKMLLIITTTMTRLVRAIPSTMSTCTTVDKEMTTKIIYTHDADPTSLPILVNIQRNDQARRACLPVAHLARFPPTLPKRHLCTQ